jgi:hypothetical protein
MQNVVLIPEPEWQQIIGRLEKLEHAELERTAVKADRPDEVLSTEQAAAYIGLSAEALRRARRTGRIQGVRLNEKDWGFRCSALDAYPRRYYKSYEKA